MPVVSPSCHTLLWRVGLCLQITSVGTSGWCEVPLKPSLHEAELAPALQPSSLRASAPTTNLLGGICWTHSSLLMPFQYHRGTKVDTVRHGITSPGQRGIISVLPWLSGHSPACTGFCWSLLLAPAQLAAWWAQSPKSCSPASTALVGALLSQDTAGRLSCWTSWCSCWHPHSLTWLPWTVTLQRSVSATAASWVSSAGWVGMCSVSKMVPGLSNHLYLCFAQWPRNQTYLDKGF